MIGALVRNVLLGRCKLELQGCAVPGVHHDVDVALGLAELTVGDIVCLLHHRRLHMEMAVHTGGIGLNRSGGPKQQGDDTTGKGLR